MREGNEASPPENAITESSWQRLQAQMQALQQQLQGSSLSAAERAKGFLDLANVQLGLEQKEAAWQSARASLDGLLSTQQWEAAAQACNIMYQAEQPASLLALAHGVWLAVAYPVNPELTVALLEHIVDETPAHSDGAAVAAVTAHYVADLRAAGAAPRENLLFMTTQLIAYVAQRHSNVQNQEQLDLWLKRLELRDPREFLPRLAKMLDIVNGDIWWFDRDRLREHLP